MIFLHDGESIVDASRGGQVVHNLPLSVAEAYAKMLSEDIRKESLRRTESGHIETVETNVPGKWLYSVR